MRPLRRELLNGLLVLVVASLLSVAFSAFQVSFNPLLWVLILMAIAIAVSGYVLFEITLGVITSAEDRERAVAESTQQREEEWLKRVGTPARLELNMGGGAEVVEAQESVSHGSNITVMYYFGSEGGKETAFSGEAREKIFSSLVELVKRGTVREYKRILCFDNDVFANDHGLMSGVLRVGEGPGTVERAQGEHYRLMMATKGCSLYVAPVVLRSVLALYGANKAAISVETVEQSGGSRRIAGILLFSDPPNGEIIEQFRQIERETERRMIAVREIRFPEDAAPA